MTLLMSVVFWRRSRPLVRVLLVLYPLAMAFSLVYLGEHYVTDFVGSVVAVFLALAAERHLRRLHTRFVDSRRARGTQVVELKPISQNTFSKS
jgi:membrane-associated phospholipid phosphatase